VALKPNYRYYVWPDGGPTAIRDLAGNPFDTGRWRFTTGS